MAGATQAGADQEPAELVENEGGEELLELAGQQCDLGCDPGTAGPAEQDAECTDLRVK